MKTIDIFKALNNETRLQILQWLKDPEKYFPPQGLHLPDSDSFPGGVCVGSICEKANISQSTISHYLDLLLRAGLLKSKRSGKWTYYRRNDQAFQELSEFVRFEL